VDAAIKNGNRPVLAQALATCRSKIALDCDSSFLHRILGNALLGLDDAPEAIINYQRAATLKPDDPAPLFGLLTAYNDMRRWRDIEIVGDKLISENWGEPDNSGAYFANRIWSATLRSANLTENVSKVFEKTLEWESRLEDLPALAVSRASAYRRVIEIEIAKTSSRPSD
jgi:tetratricopeptide (TPR) repeat protein